MKKCCFVSVLRKHSDTDHTYSYYIRYDIKPYGEFSELVTSLDKFEKIEIVNFENLSSDVNLFVSFFCMDSGDYFNTFLSDFLKPLTCKTIFFDFATYDNQEIGEHELDIIEKLTDKPVYFITKNLLQNRSNHLYFEELCYHIYVEFLINLLSYDNIILRNMIHMMKLKNHNPIFGVNIRDLFTLVTLDFIKLNF